jgi:acylphosphatase
VNELRRVHVVVRGSVQAVGFRATARSRARSLEIAGWVQNSGDGSVEAELEGSPDRVELLLAWLRYGPRGARVDSVDVETLESTGEQGFSIR